MRVLARLSSTIEGTWGAECVDGDPDSGHVQAAGFGGDDHQVGSGCDGGLDTGGHRGAVSMMRISAVGGASVQAGSVHGVVGHGEGVLVLGIPGVLGVS
ncbi:hypothetical protein GY12_01260 [Micrococcus luteus]|nr:hypothetical protein GY12_01260 [Micrococcus luteus]